VIRIKKSHPAINEKVADDGVIFLWHFSKVSINDLFSQKKNKGAAHKKGGEAQLKEIRRNQVMMLPNEMQTSPAKVGNICQGAAE
jgi:hypothetical protein